ncbi:MAG: hypothetical protein GX374_06085 [Bacilli bacterium]|nr:hypothetical protein [Bacilli bacterium]
MKTFKLKGLKVMNNQEVSVQRKHIDLIDGLVINREDEHGWLIEAFTDRKYWDFFTSIKDTKELMIQVKITREENDPAFFLTEIVSINEIGDNRMNVLFQGKIVDHSKRRIEKLLEMIIEEGYQGRSLLEKFKELI